MTVVPLGQTAKFINGAAFKPSDWGVEGLPIIRIQNLTGTGEKFNYTTRRVKQELFVDPGDLLVSWSATLDVYRWAGPRGVLNQHIFKVIPKPGVDIDYLYFALRSVIAELESKTHGSTMKHVVRGDFEGTGIPLPSLAEQRRIVDLLSRAEGIVRLRREAQKKTDEIIPALFLDMFGDPATNPKGWPVVAVGEAIASADYGSSTKASEDGSGISIIRMGNVDYAGALDLTNLKHVNLLSEESEKYLLRPGDILFNRTNSKELVGKTGLWDGRCQAVAASYFIRVRVKRAILNPFYLWAFMNSAHMKRALFDTARGAIGQANINARELRAFHIPLATLSIQDRFEKQCQDVTAIKAQQSTAIDKAQTAFDALLAKRTLPPEICRFQR
jgi:type I restriction enzyme S subunit